MATIIFANVGAFKQGYDPETVDSFFAKARSAYEGGVPAEQFSALQVQQASFPLKRGGYETKKVDSALNRLASAFVQRDRIDFISVQGESAWFSRVTERATSLYPRLLRPSGERFSHPDRGERGYSVLEVDQFLDRLTAYFDEQAQMTVSEARHVLFRSAKGTNAYKESQVDSYLARAIEILLAVA